MKCSVRREKRKSAIVSRTKVCYFSNPLVSCSFAPLLRVINLAAAVANPSPPLPAPLALLKNLNVREKWNSLPVSRRFLKIQAQLFVSPIVELTLCRPKNLKWISEQINIFQHVVSISFPRASLFLLSLCVCSALGRQTIFPTSTAAVGRMGAI